MAVVLNGADIVSTDPAGPWPMPLQWGLGRGNADHPLISFFRQQGYDYMYRHQPSVRKVVGKKSDLMTMVPLKVWRTTRAGRVEAPGSPYGRLLANPSSRMSAVKWRKWMASINLLHGEAFAAKVRDPLGRPIELPPIHPLRMRYGPEQGRAWKVADQSRLTEHERDTKNFWWYRLDDSTEFQIARRDLIVWAEFNPGSCERGTSKLEALRSTLEDDAAARAAVEAMWKHGGKPGFVLQTDKTIAEHPAVLQAIAEDFQAAHGGVTKWQKPLVLDGGLKVQELRTDKNLEYLGLRKLTDQEVAAVYDITGPAVHILDHANFASVVELFRDVYRSAMPPMMQDFEATLDFDLRDGRHGQGGEPDFGSAFHCEHVIDGVMKGAPEQRHESYARQIQTGQRTPNEIRALENLPPVDGGDTLFINGAVVPIELAGEPHATASGEGIAVDGAGEDSPGLPPIEAALSPSSTATVMGRLSRPQSLDDIDVERLVDGLDVNEETAVRAAYEDALDVPELRAAIKGMRIR